MSEAILTFQVQLSGVMETVLKSAMYEITRLVEDSFLEEVARSKQEVEALKQRLQWSESRRREREGGGRVRCADCRRVGVSSEGTEGRDSGTGSGVDEGHGLKQEKVLGGDWRSCTGELSNPGPISAPEEVATPSPIRAPEMCTTSPTNLEGGGTDPLLKVEDLQETHSGDDVQGKWLVCPEGAEGDSTDPSPAHNILSEQQGRQRAGDTSGMYLSEPGQEHATHRLSLAGSQHCTIRRDDLDSDGDMQEIANLVRTDFTQGSSDSESQSVLTKLQPDGDNLPSLRSLDVKPLSGFSDAVPVKQEVEALSEWSEQISSKDVYTQTKQRRENRPRAQMQVDDVTDLSSSHSPLGECSRVEDLTLQPRLHQCSSSGKHTQVRLSDRTAVTQSSATSDKGGCTSYSRDFIISKNMQNYQKVERRFSTIHIAKSITQILNIKSPQRQHTDKTPHSCSQCGKTFSHFCHLKAHQQTHTGERPFCCTLCGRSFTKLSNLKAHRRVHTGERPYICTECGKRFTQKCNLKRHQRIHTAERLFSCK